jgi:adenine-specific DNA-methyltransferase
MIIKPVNPRLALNKSFLKVKPHRNDIESFKSHLIELLGQIDEKESEEFHKNIIIRFLEKTYYAGRHYINTKGRNDLVIHNDKDAKSSVGVIVETKKPTNKTEMTSKDNLNTKAFQELILYYMRERISGNNLEVRHLVITNIYEWFFFDVDIFEKAFAQNKVFEKQFIDFEEKRLAGKNTDFFYKEIAEPAVTELLAGHSKAGKEIKYTYFDIREYEKILRNNDKKDDIKLIALYKLLSPEHLLKLPFKNDSNTLDKGFYSEFLHILGLTEKKDGGKKLIDRKDSGKQDEGSIIENTITQLDSLDKISRLEKSSNFGATSKERYFNVGLELVITWVNRILFLKLLEAQLITYHKGDKSYSFLNNLRIKNFDDLNSLFFQVLAKQSDERNVSVKQVFAKIPYLNSSLFEPTDLEHSCLFISQLQDNKEIPILPSTVLKDNIGKKRTGKLNALEYLFEFLDAYDFSSEGSEDIQEENKTLISASVLGLIFEKINGYKDGSFFTPGFITMYMCRDTIRQSVIQKFNETKGWDCKTIDQLFDKIENKKEANEIINSLKICDPAVGSGHYLVSALNEIIALKSDLKILLNREGRTLRDYHIEVSNDELAITDEEGNLFEYNPKIKESQNIQETLFHEKQIIIENCLFGVDINPNSVKICRLRLWIELLKNAYYKADSNYTQLETLPNIDINIKCGNSLISRFPLEADLSSALKKSKITIKSYKHAVQSYRHATSKEQKRDMENLIARIKGDFRTEISNNDPKIKKLRSKRGDLDKLINQHSLFELSKSEKKEQKKQQSNLELEIENLKLEIEEIKSNKLFENAFEWRFEFPEVLSENGEFVGFDVTIGNPPYGVKEKGKKYLETVEKYYPIARKVPDSYFLFIVKGYELVRPNGLLNYIVPNTFCDIEQGSDFRKWMLNETDLFKIYDSSWVFEDAVVDTAVFFLAKTKSKNIITIVKKNNESYIFDTNLYKNNSGYKIDYRADQSHKELLGKIELGSNKLNTKAIIKAGVKLYEKGKGKPSQTEEIVNKKPYTKIGEKISDWRPLIRGGDIHRYKLNPITEYVYYGEWLAAPRENTLFEGERLIIRRTDDVIRATFISDDSVCVNSCHVVKVLNSEDIKYILAVLNSRLMQWVFEIKNPQMVGKAFAEIKVTYVEELPIRMPEEFSNINNCVDNILSAYSNNNVSEVKRLESQLDNLIYKTYSLTKEDIKVIEKG